MISKSKHNYNLHCFICTKAKEGKSSCGPIITQEMVKEIKDWNRELGNFPMVKITQTGCLGQCNVVGGAMIVFPSNTIYQGIRSVKEVKEIVYDELRH